MKAKFYCLLGLALLAAGCAVVGPDYVRPELSSPAQWSEPAAKSGQAEGLERSAWWKALNDPVLDELMEAAARGNLDLEQARARVMQARAQRKSAGAAYAPTANLGASLTRAQESENTGATAANYTLFTPGLDASWELDMFGGSRRGVEAAQARLEASVEGLHDSLLTVLGDVANAYIELRAAQAQLAITRDNLAAQTHTAQLTGERYRLGLTSHLDATQAEAQKTATAAQIPSYQSTIRQCIHRLGILTGQEPAALDQLLTPARPLPSGDGLAAPGLPSQLLARRPDLRQTERKLAAASADIGVATAQLYPKFDLTLGLGLSSDTASKLTSLSSGYWSLTPQLAVLLFDGGKTKAAIEEKQAIYDEALAAYKAAFLSALGDVENALSSYAQEETRRRALARSAQACQEYLDLAQERYRRGLTNFLDVLDAQRSLYSAQISLNQAQAGALTYLISLYKALGGGWNASEVAEALRDRALQARSTS